MTINRSFGIELEMIMPAGMDRSQVAIAIAARGIPCHAEGYNHETRPRWKIVTDGSLSGNGAEVVSPILHGEAGLDAAAQVCEALQDLGCTVNRSCGFHVHIDAADLTARTLATTVQLYANYEMVIDRIMPPSRRGAANTFCNSMARHDNAAYTNIRSVSDLCRLFPGRYWKVNLASMARHGTIEFRQHSGTLDGAKVRNWVLFCQRLVAKAVEGVDIARTEEITTAIDPQVRNARPGTKRHKIVQMILRPEGATREEITRETNWPSVSIAQIAQSTGLTILTERQGRTIRYRVNRQTRTETVTRGFDRLDISLNGLCTLLEMPAGERTYFETRTRNLSSTAVEWAA